MNNAVVIGAGGHARTVIALLRDCRRLPVAILDINEPMAGEAIMGVKVLPLKTSFNDFSADNEVDFYIAIGDNNGRRSWWERLTSLGLSCPNLISPFAHVDESAVLSGANVVCSNVYVGPQASIGYNNILNTGSIIEHEVEIANHCHIAPGSVVAGRACISDSCFVGAGSTIIDKIKLSSGVTLGAGGIMVTHAHEENGLYVGCPAIFKKPIS